MKTVFIVLLLSGLFSYAMFSQVTTIYQKGRIVTTDGNIIPFEKASADEALFRYINEAGPGAILAEYVVGIDIKTETKALAGALQAGFFGLAFGALLSAGLSGESRKPSFFLLSGLSGLAGSVFGGIIGGKKEKFKTVYINREDYGETGSAWRLEIVAGSQPVGLALRMSF